MPYNSRSDRFCPFLDPNFDAAAVVAAATAAAPTGIVGVVPGGIVTSLVVVIFAASLFIPDALLLSRTAICRPCPAPYDPVFGLFFIEAIVFLAPPAESP
jgi:hypothetical protein